jgi:aminobenzoyl-glutamate transport protein
MSSRPAPKARKKRLLPRILDVVEDVGNRVPHPAVIFVILIGMVVLLSHVLYRMGAAVTHPVINPATHQLETLTEAARSLLTPEGIRFLFVSVVPNFMSFNAVGMIIVAMVGVGLAEEAGLIGVLIRKLVAISPPSALTYILVFVGVLSSVASDAGYLVLIPLGAAAFLSVGRHPLAGMAASFAGVGAAFGVNLLIKPIDGILTEITNDAIHLIDPTKSVDLTANLWFAIASVALLTIVISLVTDNFVEPRLGKYIAEPAAEQAPGVSRMEKRGLRWALYGLLGVLAVFAVLTLPPGAPLRNSETGALIGNSPFMNGLIVFVTAVFLVTGAAFGFGAKTLKSSLDVVNAMAKAVSGLGGLILLLLIISQFLALFSYTRMATIAAVRMAEFLQGSNLGALPLLLGFILVTVVVSVIIVGIIPKWAMFAPLFIPLMMKLSVSPDAVLAAYRVGDSPMNVITPLNAYFALVVTFARKYDKRAGVGTVVALMLPYCGIVLLAWMLLFAAWFLLGLPWGL